MSDATEVLASPDEPMVPDDAPAVVTPLPERPKKYITIELTERAEVFLTALGGAYAQQIDAQARLDAYVRAETHHRPMPGGPYRVPPEMQEPEGTLLPELTLEEIAATMLERGVTAQMHAVTDTENEPLASNNIIGLCEGNPRDGIPKHGYNEVFRLPTICLPIGCEVQSISTIRGDESHFRVLNFTWGAMNIVLPTHGENPAVPAPQDEGGCAGHCDAPLSHGRRAVPRLQP